MPTPKQIQLIQIARRQVGLTEQQYRLLLINVADVESCTELDNAGVEDVMAVMEDMGFRTLDRPGDYWRGKVRRRGVECNERMVHKIGALAAEQGYPVSAICLRHSHRRTEHPEHLYPDEAFKVIEALKAIVDRQ